MTEKKKMTFLPAVYAIPKIGAGIPVSLPSASPNHIPLHAAVLPPEFPRWDEPTQVECVGRAIREHYLRNQGCLPFMGPIVTYLLHGHPDSAPIPFSTEGPPLTASEAISVPQITFTSRESSLSRRAFIHSLCSRDENTFH